MRGRAERACDPGWRLCQPGGRAAPTRPSAGGWARPAEGSMPYERGEIDPYGHERFAGIGNRLA
ncbi:hypothetical protein, partial [Streptomyces sp. NPDC127098]|uniref:hypothetical protein n=1 Tax=Streptomyces sp. NPDC127098 TaxID=3347137 RepID=UPI0036688CF5